MGKRKTTAKTNNGAIALKTDRFRRELDYLRTRLEFLGDRESAEDILWAAIFVEKVYVRYRKNKPV